MRTKKCTRCKQIKNEKDYTSVKEKYLMAKCKKCLSELYYLKKQTPCAIKDLDGEIWKSVLGHEGFYSVSNRKRVKSLYRNIVKADGKKYTHLEKILSIKISKQGYNQLKIRDENGRKTVKLYRLVAEAFIPNPDNKPCVNHINGIKTDDRVENLEWTTYSENAQHAWDTGLNTRRIGELNKSSKLKENQVLEILKNNRKLTRIELSKEYNVSKTLIDKIVQRKVWQHLG